MEEVMELDFSGSTTTTTTTPVLSMDEDAGWADWGPGFDWDSLGPVPDYDDLGGLIDSLMAEYESSNCDLEVSTDLVEPHWLPPVELDKEEKMAVGGGGQGDEDTKGVRLVHLLLAAAEALTGVHRSRDLAGVILVRLKELASPAGATTMERLAAHFTDALRGLLDGCAAGKLVPEPPCQQAEAIAAFQFLQDMSPYVKFGHFTANQAIVEAVSGDRRIHVLDYDIMEGVQWASLMQALVSRKDGPPAPHLRITALTRGGGCSRKSVASVQETGRRLAAFAASIGQPFSFHHCRLDPEENFRPAAVKMVKGEALVVNCMLHFSHRPRDSVASFLSGALELGPRIVTLVEEELGPASGPGFLSLFMDSLHQYSALYDSLEAGFPMQSRARALVERVFLGPKIAGSVSRSFRAQKIDECWENWMVGSGFRPTGISYFNQCQAKLLVGLFNDGYRVEEVGPNKLILGWKARGLLTASTWAAPAPESPSQSESDYLN